MQETSTPTEAVRLHPPNTVGLADGGECHRSSKRRLVATPEGLAVCGAQRLMELVDEVCDLGTHNGEDMGSSPSGEGVNGSTRNHHERARIDSVAYPIHFDFELAVEADERFLAAVMHMQRSLIAFVRVERPVPDDEVGHRVGILANPLVAHSHFAVFVAEAPRRAASGSSANAMLHPC